MPKLRLRYFVYFVFGMCLMLGSRRPICRITPEDLFFSGLIFIVVTTAAELFFLIRRSYLIKAHLDRGDVGKFLEETSRELRYSTGAWKRCYQINKTAGLYYLGRFEEALSLLDTISVQKLPALYRTLYMNNRLANLLGAKRIEEAQKLVDAHEKIFQPAAQNQKIYYALQSNLGILKYHQGERQTARYLIQESLKSHKFPLAQAVAHYFLGRIAQDEGLAQEAAEHFQKARELGGNIYVAGLIGNR